MKRVELTIRGTSPLLMHNVRLANPMDPFAKRLAELNRAKRVKGADKEAVAEQMARVEWEGGLYLDKDGPVLPARNIHKSILEAARLTKEGKGVERGTFAVESAFRLVYDGPRTIEEMWAHGGFVHAAEVVVGGSKVVRTRPIFSPWEATIRFAVNPEVCEPERFVEYVRSAGTFIGTCDGHKGIYGMGRFEVLP